MAVCGSAEKALLSCKVSRLAMAFKDVGARLRCTRRLGMLKLSTFQILIPGAPQGRAILNRPEAIFCVYPAS